jgi:hypothetical protein
MLTGLMSDTPATFRVLPSARAVHLFHLIKIGVEELFDEVERDIR